MRSKPLLLVLIAILFWGASGVLGVVMGVWSIREIRLDYDSQSWPTTSGYILTSDVSVGATNRFGSTSYWPEITYKYQVDDQPYINSTIIFGQNGSAMKYDAELAIKKYAPDVPVTVYYHPENPQYACLEPGHIVWQTYMGLGIAAFFFIAGVGGVMKAVS